MTTTTFATEPAYEHSHEAAGESSMPNWILAAVFSAVAIGLAVVQANVKGWILVPLFFCGLLTSVDAIQWLRRKLDLFDPIGLMGLISVHFFFIAPLLHLVWNEWMAYVKPLSDWDEWVGWMAVINVVGLLLYRATRSWAFRRRRPAASTYRAASGSFYPLLAIGLAITFAAQVLVYWSFGGLMGYIYAFEHVQSEFLGMGWVFMISESFPILCIMGFALYQGSRGRQTPWPVLAVVLLIFFALAMMFGGLRGSRMNTLWGLFWAVGIIHFLIRPVPRSAIFAGGLAILMFLYVYGFYKARGLSGLEAVSDAGARSSIQRTYHRTFEALLLGDLARADVQSYVLRQTCSPRSSYQWAWGQTYVGTLALMIPRQLWANRPPDKVAWGTQALYPGQTHVRASNVYGIAGEAMLNFGPVGALLSFAVIGIFVGKVRVWVTQLEPGDIRGMVAPFMITLCATTMMGDSDNVLFILIKQGAIPFLIVYLGSRALQAPPAEEPM